MADSAASQWFVSAPDRSAAEFAIAAFPAAGAGCSAFAQHVSTMPEWLDLMTLNMPGRQARFNEPFRTDLDALADEIAQACAELGKPYLIFGYCTGAILAYCVTRTLEQRHMAMPKMLVIGSFMAPHLADDSKSLSGLDSDTLWKYMVEQQAVTAELASDPELRQIAEPALRADLALIAGYRHVSAPPLPIPLTVLMGETDEWSMARGGIAAWATYTSQAFEVRRLPVGHWFMEEDPATAALALQAEAAKVRG